MKVYIGIDWSEEKHDVCFMNEKGGVIQKIEIKHKPEGFMKLDQARQMLGVKAEECWVGLETSHNLLVDYLFDNQYENVYVMPPAMVKGNRSRYGVGGAKDDQRDAELIAEIMRTDHQRLHPWQPDSALTRQMRAKVSLINFLRRSIRRHSNRLRAVLLRYYPVAPTIFTALDSPITLAFLRAYPNPRKATRLSYEEFKSFLRQNHHPRPSKWPECYARLTTPAPVAAPEIVQIYQSEALLLAELLSSCTQAKKQALKELQSLFQQHPDRAIFQSLPGAGEFLQPALLAKFGDHRQRFPSRAVVQAVAGTSPITRKSGKRRSVLFRKACDREFRFIAQAWAKASIRVSPWAASYYDQTRPSCRSSNDAYRRLANRWLAILWKLWQSHSTYDEAYHLQQRALRALPRP